MDVSSHTPPSSSSSSSFSMKEDVFPSFLEVEEEHHGTAALSAPASFSKRPSSPSHHHGEEEDAASSFSSFPPASSTSSHTAAFDTSTRRPEKKKSNHHHTTTAKGWSFDHEVHPRTGESAVEQVYAREQLRYQMLLSNENGALPAAAYADGSISPHFFVGFSHYDYRLRDVYRAILAKHLSAGVRHRGLSSSIPLLGASNIQLSVSWSGRFHPKAFHRVQRVCGVRLHLPLDASPTSDAQTASSTSAHPPTSPAATTREAESGPPSTTDRQSRPDSSEDKPQWGANEGEKAEQWEGGGGGSGATSSSASTTTTTTTTHATMDPMESASPSPLEALPDHWQRSVRSLVQHINRHENEELLSLRFFQASDAIPEVTLNGTPFMSGESSNSGGGDGGALTEQTNNIKKTTLERYRVMTFFVKSVLQRFILRGHVCLIVLGHGTQWQLPFDATPTVGHSHAVEQCHSTSSTSSLSSGTSRGVKEPPEAHSFRKEEEEEEDDEAKRKKSGTDASGGEKEKKEMEVGSVEATRGPSTSVEPEAHLRSRLEIESRVVQHQKRTFLYGKHAWLKLFHTRHVIPAVVSLPSLAVLVAVEMMQQGEWDTPEGKEDATTTTADAMMASFFSMLEEPVRAFVTALAAVASTEDMAGRHKGKDLRHGASHASLSSSATSVESETPETPTAIMDPDNREGRARASEQRAKRTSGDDTSEREAEEAVWDEESRLRQWFVQVVTQGFCTPLVGNPTTNAGMAHTSSRAAEMNDVSDRRTPIDTVDAASLWLQLLHHALQQCVGAGSSFHSLQNPSSTPARADSLERGGKDVRNGGPLSFPFFFLHGTYGGSYSEMEYLKRNKTAADAVVLHPAHTSMKNLLRRRQEKNRKKSLALGIPVSRKGVDFDRGHRRPALFDEMMSMDHHAPLS